MKWAALAAAAIMLAMAAANAGPRVQQRLVGVASVIDGDTIEIRGQRIRLFGIDAPEKGQSCTRQAGRVWRCGQKAAFALADLLGRKALTCEARDWDRYGRMDAVCTAGEDIGAWMVRNGWAVAYRAFSRDYVGAERQARAQRIGLWSGRFDNPWDWRKANKNKR